MTNEEQERGQYWLQSLKERIIKEQDYSNAAVFREIATYVKLLEEDNKRLCEQSNGKD